MKLFLRIAIIVLAVLVAVVGAVTGWYFYMQTAPVKAGEAAVASQDSADAGAETLTDGSEADGAGEASESAENADEPYILKIPVGTGVPAVAAELEEHGLIRSADIFYLKARLEKFEMKAGRYTVRPTMSMSEIFALLASGKQDHISVSIPEGLTTSQIAQLLVDSDVILSKEEFIKETKNPEILEKYKIAASSLEGYLFPDTYFFNPSMNPDDVIERLVDNFFARIDSLEIPSDDMKKLHDTVILASIVEREYCREEEAPLIASVFKNRLDHHIGLESCATIVYILTEIEGRPHPERITYEDLKIDSIYNTYKWAGLPAGPISNPGAIALKAAANPPKTNYYYFRVVDEATGTHHFSSSLEEHAKTGRDLAVKAAAGK
ncbi:MAG: endolytic transglycosylase MltG [Spirochaetaceae bacterium]|nr:endolytic transglycosylase MltG [Spirochaetaceae bacterium]